MTFIFTFTYLIAESFVLGCNSALYVNLVSLRNDPDASSGNEERTSIFIYFTVATIATACAAMTLSATYVVLTKCTSFDFSDKPPPAHESDPPPSTVPRRPARLFNWNRLFTALNYLFLFLSLAAIAGDFVIAQLYSNSPYRSAIVSATLRKYTSAGDGQEYLRNQTQRKFDCCFYRNTTMDNYATAGTQFDRPAKQECPSSWESLCLRAASCTSTGCSLVQYQTTATPCNCINVVADSLADTVSEISTFAYWAFGVELFVFVLFMAIDMCIHFRHDTRPVILG